MGKLVSQKRLLLLLISLMIAVIFLHLIYHKAKFFPQRFFQNIRISIYGSDIIETEDSSPYLTKSSHCKIPKTPLFPAYFNDEWRVDNIPDCKYEIKNFLSMDDDEFVTFFPRDVEEKCCLQEIVPNKTKYTLTDCILFPAGTTLSVHGKEIFSVTCNTSMNVDATFPIKPQVSKKLKYWRQEYAENKKKSYESGKPIREPPNILLLGIDSVSRLHAQRSLPKTLALLKELNFLEFKGYHSVGPNTLSNFIPMLLGQTIDEMRRTCATNWTSSFDSCPFIWNKFENYVTNFIEDGEGSFSWGGLGGFKSPPTDYNIPHLFRALKKLRLKSFSPNATWFTKEMFADCLSSETVPEFVLRYTRRFINKFSDVPFFSFSFLAYPFHEYLYSLKSLDESLHDFFQHISSIHNDDGSIDLQSDSVFDNTLILFFSDHGARTSEFSSTVEGFVERSLPVFYMKLPKVFREEFPYQSFRINAVKNTKRLTTAFDVHQTLLHTVQLFLPPSEKPDDSSIHSSASSSSFAAQEENFSLDDRSSLFQLVPADRDCSSVNIPAQSCVCDATINSESNVKSSPLILENVMAFLSLELNKILKTSNYSHLCKKWSTDTSKIISFRHISDRWIDSKSDSATEYLVSFSADPDGAKFDSRLLISNQVVQKNDEESPHYDIQLVGSLMRINSYRNQSHCIPFQTDVDKEMKQFCVCKE